jgi:transcription antitermination factor NusG
MNKNWYALYTKSRQERKVELSLAKEGIESYVPVQKILRQWSDRKKWVEVPFITSYCFVHCRETELQKVTSRVGAVKLIWFSGKPAIIPDQQIETVRKICNSDLSFEVISENLLPGQKAKITHGLLSGLEGEIVRHSGKEKVLFRIDHVSHQVLVTLPATFLSV